MKKIHLLGVMNKSAQTVLEKKRQKSQKNDKKVINRVVCMKNSKIPPKKPCANF